MNIDASLPTTSSVGPGRVVALEDRCPHRLLPLSKGKRVGDDVQCGYHGMTFDADTGGGTIDLDEKIPNGDSIGLPESTDLHRPIHLNPFARRERRAALRSAK